MTEQAKASPTERVEPRDELRLKALRRIKLLESLFNRNLLILAAFIAISIFAARNFDSIPPLPDQFKVLMGTPPAGNWISSLLIIYCFSSIVLILGKMTLGTPNTGSLANLGYLSGFYLFYYLAGILDKNFWAAFAAGITILCLESFHAWIYCSDEIRKERDTLAELDRYGKV